MDTVAHRPAVVPPDASTTPPERDRPDETGLVGALADEVGRTAARLDDAGVAPEPSPGHPASLALCVLEAVWTPRVTAPTTAAVVGGFCRRHGVEAGPAELLAAVASAGGDAAWAASCATSHRVRSHPEAPLKVTAARLAAQVLVDAGVDSPVPLLALLDDLRSGGPGGAARERWDAVREAWCAVPGQRSGRSWHRLLLLAGAGRVVPDEDVRRFVSRWARGLVAGTASGGRPTRAGGRPDALTSAGLLERAAEVAGTSPRVVDHVVWRGELLRGASRRRPGGPDVSSAPPPP